MHPGCPECGVTLGWLPCLSGLSFLVSETRVTPPTSESSWVPDKQASHDLLPKFPMALAQMTPP